jgi:hypothetical protein
MEHNVEARAHHKPWNKGNSAYWVDFTGPRYNISRGFDLISYVSIGCCRSIEAGRDISKSYLCNLKAHLRIP